VRDEQEARWRRLYREHLQEEGSPACPAPELLAAAATGELDEGERQQVAAHVVACRRCAADFRTLLALHQEAAAARQPRRWLLPLAAGLGLLVFGLVLFRIFVGRPDGRGPSPLRTATAPRPAATVPPPDAHLAAPPAEIAWPPQEDAAGYRLELDDASGVRVWTSGPLEAPRATLPAAVRARLVPGESYSWAVEIAGPRKRRLGPFWFDLAREPGR